MAMNRADRLDTYTPCDDCGHTYIRHGGPCDWPGCECAAFSDPRMRARNLAPARVGVVKQSWWSRLLWGPGGPPPGQ